MSSGWISLHRKIWDNFLFPKNREFTKFEAWIDLLLMANHKEQKVFLKSTMYNVKRGQIVRSMKTLSERWKWSRSKVKRYLKMIQECSMIELKTDTITTTITICNYDSYQDGRTSNEHQTDIKRTSNEHQTDIKNNDNKVNNVDNDNKNAVFNFKKELISYGFEKQLVEDWLAVRKSKKAKNTQTAYDGFIREVEKTSYDKNELLRYLVENSWAGFKASWSINLNGTPTQDPKQKIGPDVYSEIMSNIPYKRHFAEYRKLRSEHYENYFNEKCTYENALHQYIRLNDEPKMRGFWDWIQVGINKAKEVQDA